MDDELEIEKLVHFLFSEEIPDGYLDQPEFVDYIKYLGSLTVEQLYDEKKMLEEEKVTIDNHTRHLALTNYKTFIQIADCSHTVHKNVYFIQNILNLLSDEIPNFLSKCEYFANNSSEIKEKKRKNNLILSNYMEILQILEIPQFMNSCIHYELYEEVLLLSSFVKRLASIYEDIPLIKNIAKNVDESWWDLMRKLQKHLTTDISLPKFLQIIGYLRRMNVLSETELRLKFFQSRNFWLDSLLSSIPTDNKNQHLSATIDVTRVNVFNIVTQYRAAFSEEESVSDLYDLRNKLFYIWLNKRINNFLAVVQDDLPLCTPSSLDSLLGQCMYFGQSFGRIGTDFRGLVIQHFVTTIQNNFRVVIEKANEHFTDNLENYVLPKTTTLSHKDDFNISDQILNAPTILLEYYPLAVYYNDLMTGFNDLRYCSLVGTVSPITNLVQSSLEHVASSLFLFHEKEHITWIDKEKKIFNALCMCYSKVFLPTIQRCLHDLYKPDIIAEHLGVSISHVEDEGLGYLKVPLILHPLQPFL